MNATITTNPEFNGIEISFTEKPARCTLDALKAQGFRWHNKKAIWYAKNTPERMEAAQAICSIGDYALQVLAEEAAENRPAYGKGKKKTAEKSQPVNKFGVKVGDIFSASWGYEQTNNDFFQVVALVGESSVRVREVYLPLVDSLTVGPMAEDRTFKVTHELLPAANYSVFIKDQEKGDLKRLKSYAADGKSNPQFNLSSFCDAHYCSADNIEVYESWYA